MHLNLQPYRPLTKYPHLVASDIPVWDTFVRRFPDLFDGVTYDLHVGVGLQPGEDVAPHLQRMWTGLTQKRIDVLAAVEDLLFVIEVKDRPGLAALGQVLGYVALLSDLPHPGQRLIPLIVAAVIEPDVETAIDFYGVRFYDLSDDHNNLIDADGTLIR